MRRPIVRTIRQPPIAVPSVSAAPQANFTQSGTESVLDVPAGEQQRGDHAHRLLRVVGAVAEGERGRHRPLGAADRRPHARVRPAQRRAGRGGRSANPKPSPSSGETASAIRTPKTPTGCQPSSPPQLTASMPALRQRRADQPADQRVRRARRQPAPPGQQVPERRPPSTPGADHRDRLGRRDGDDPGDRVGDRGADQQRAEHVEDGRQHDRLPGRAPRVATSVAIALAASWKPFVSANASPSAMASHSPISTSSRSPHGASLHDDAALGHASPPGWSLRTTSTGHGA